MRDHLEKKERHMKTMGLTLQPHVVVVCEDLEKLDTVNGSVAYAVIQSNLFYEMASVLAAADTCFKAAFVMHLNYPVAAKSTWTFIQTAVFNISTEHDGDLGSRILELLSDSRQ
jgi:hypothetical protein